MKAYRIISILPEAVMITVASALLLSSCAKEKAVGTADGELIEYTLQAEVAGTGIEAGLDIDTKVALYADGITPIWEEDDEILVLDANRKPVGANGKFTLSEGAGTASGKFSGTVYVGQTPAYAIYPASAATVRGTSAVTGGTLSAPAGDDAGTIKAAVMLGSSSDGTAFSFTNACAVLKFNTGDYGKSGGDHAIKKVRVSASYGETAAPITGAFKIDWTTLSIAAASDAVNKLTVTLPSALQADGKDVYVPIFPLPKNRLEVAPSMKYEFTRVDGCVAEVSHDFSAAIATNTLKDLGTASGMEFIAPYVEIPAKYDGRTTTTLKWYRQNLAISASGNKEWKDRNAKAVKAPGTNMDVIVGDYFQWAAYAGYCGEAVDADEGLLVYKSFINIRCGDGSNKFTFKSGKQFESLYAPYYNSSSTYYSKYTSGSPNLERGDDVANIILGENWRMPTSEEFTKMKAATYWAWDTDDIGYYVYIPASGDEGGVNGYKADGSTPIIGSYDKSTALLFFPASGHAINAGFELVGQYIECWSSTLYSQNIGKYARYLSCTSNSVSTGYNDSRAKGHSVRPVSE